MKKRTEKNIYEKKRTMFIRIVALICALLIFGSVLLGALYLY